MKQKIDQSGQIIHADDVVLIHIGIQLIEGLGMVGEQVVDHTCQIIHRDVLVPIHVTGQDTGINDRIDRERELFRSKVNR